MSAEPERRPGWARRRIHVAGRMRDGVRLLGATVYWNVRKTWYLLRGRAGDAPCQHRIDVQDGVAPRCEAVWHWEAAGRFRRVCPALKRTPDGWRCSVTAAQVRPFWGRALIVYGVLALALYLGAAAGLWLVWRAAGYRNIEYSDVAWPGRWARVKPKQAAYFRELGRKALENGDYSSALLSFSTAETFQRGGLEERLLLARLWAQSGNVAFAKRDVRAMLAEFPDRAGETAAVWHDQLLASGQFEGVAEFCSRRLVEAGAAANESLWEFSLLYALDHGQNAESLVAAWKRDKAEIPKRVGDLAEVLAQWQRGEFDGAAGRLATLRFEADEPLATRCQIEWLARLGNAGEAGLVLNRHAMMLGGFEAAALRYFIDTESGDLDAAHANFLGMLRYGPLTVTQADRLCALAIGTRDGASLRRTPGFFELEPLKSNASAQAAFWVAALACKEPSLVAGARARYETVTRAESLPVVAELNFRKRNPWDRNSPLFIASFVPLPRETVYALVGARVEALVSR